ncbi:MAG: TrkH family potassium uptake protein, partial [Synergistaceae bacterium]|nr:TrkH family potassium uptake protein [Synergistaceae bacterium]
MKITTVSRVLSFICFVVSIAMMPPLFLALYDGSHDETAFAVSIMIGIFVGVVLTWHGGKKTFSMGIREGVGVTGFSWLIASAVGALPYWLSN